MTVSSITNAFSEAARQLGFSFEPDFTLVLDGGEVINTLGLVRGFGSEAGTVLFSERSTPSKDVQTQAKNSGYYVSFLFDSYSSYDEALFKDTLNDWQYFGSEFNSPSWFTGEVWGAKNEG